MYIYVNIFYYVQLCKFYIHFSIVFQVTDIYNKYTTLYPSCDFVLALFMFTRFGTYVPSSEISHI